MKTEPINKFVDGNAAALNEVPLDEEGNPVCELPTFMEDELSDGSDNPLGNLVCGMARAIARRNT